MELDDLKKAWQESETKKTKNTNIMELIHQKSYGPIAALKREFSKQIRMMIIIPILIILVNVRDWNTTLASAIFWSYVVFCLGVIAYAYFNLRLVSKMDGMNMQVKSNLQKQVSLLEARVKGNIIGVRIAFLYFIVLVEVLPYFQHLRMVDKWHTVSPLTRFAVYGGFLLFQFFVTRRMSRQKFGNHLQYLKGLVAELQD